MTGSGTAARRRVLMAGLIGLALAALLAPPDVAPWFIGSGALLAIGAWFADWYERRGPGAILRGLVETWAELPGAELDGGAVRVHDGMQPLVVRLAREREQLRAVVQTPTWEGPAAWRVWPRQLEAPGLAADGGRIGGPPVSRRPEVEARTGGVLRIDASDADATQHLDSELLSAVLGVMQEHPRAFHGLTYDGQRISVHLAGPVVADPERAAAVARRLWSRLVP